MDKLNAIRTQGTHKHLHRQLKRGINAHRLIRKLITSLFSSLLALSIARAGPSIRPSIKTVTHHETFILEGIAKTLCLKLNPRQVRRRLLYDWQTNYQEVLGADNRKFDKHNLTHTIISQLKAISEELMIHGLYIGLCIVLDNSIVIIGIQQLRTMLKKKAKVHYKFTYKVPLKGKLCM